MGCYHCWLSLLSHPLKAMTTRADVQQFTGKQRRKLAAKYRQTVHPFQWSVSTFCLSYCLQQHSRVTSHPGGEGREATPAPHVFSTYQPIKHFIKNGTKAPPVYCVVVGLLLNDFWCEVLEGKLNRTVV